METHNLSLFMLYTSSCAVLCVYICAWAQFRFRAVKCFTFNEKRVCISLLLSRSQCKTFGSTASTNKIPYPMSTFNSKSRSRQKSPPWLDNNNFIPSGNTSRKKERTIGAAKKMFIYRQKGRQQKENPSKHFIHNRKKNAKFYHLASRMFVSSHLREWKKMIVAASIEKKISIWSTKLPTYSHTHAHTKHIGIITHSLYKYIYHTRPSIHPLLHIKINPLIYMWCT